MIKKLCLSLAVLLFAVVPSVAFAASLTVAWVPSPDGVGTNLYYGGDGCDPIDTENCTATVIDAGDASIYTIEGLSVGVTYTVRGKAYNVDGVESPFSYGGTGEPKFNPPTEVRMAN